MQHGIQGAAKRAGHWPVGQFRLDDPCFVGLGDGGFGGGVQPQAYMVVGDGVVSAPEERPDFAVVHGGQFPKPASPFSLFLVQEDFSVMAGDEDIFFDGDDWPSRFFQWQGGRVGGLAPWAHGAEQAGRGTGSAEALAEFHQGGVIRSHVLGGQQAFRPFPELALADGAVDFDVEIHQSGEDAG